MNAPSVSVPAFHNQGNDQAHRWQAWTSRPGAMDELCDALAADITLLEWTQAHDFNYRQVAKWIRADPTRADEYAETAEILAGRMVDEVRALTAELMRPVPESEMSGGHSNGDRRQRVRVRLDALKWCVRRFQPLPTNGRRRSDVDPRRIVKEELGRIIGPGWEEELDALYNLPPVAPSAKFAPKAPVSMPGKPVSPASHTAKAASTTASPALPPEAAATKHGKAGVQTVAYQSGTPVPGAGSQVELPSVAPVEPRRGGTATPTDPGAQKPKPQCVKLVGRNEPCPCGSGKKFKKCCGR